MEKHAYLIIAHNDFYTLEKLIKILDDYRNDIFIHIDKKVRNFNFDYFKRICKFSKIEFVERIKVFWGDFSIIEAELNLYRSAIKGNYKYYHLLSGADLPIKSQDYIHDFFDKNSGTEFLTSLKDEFTQKQNIKDRIYKYHLFLRFKSNNKILNYIENLSLKFQDLLNINRFDKNYKIYYGSQWASLTHYSVKYLLSKEQWIIKYFNYTLCGDEVYKQTVLINNENIKNKLYLREYNSAHVSYNMRHIDWSRGGPYVFKENDYNELLNVYSLFARKFNSNQDYKIIDKIYGNFKR
ncbi:glycosyl transferase [Terrisporobacter glycolicus]|nr:glycosyl transferase [Terrisporobacter glycolicus]